jgi:hypothetical protein
MLAKSSRIWADTGFLYAPARMGGLFYGIADFKGR